jgi:three-Cys-motif partner protein
VPNPKLTDDWLREKVADLVSAGKPLSAPPDFSFEARSWTLLKLACVRYYVAPYLQILRSKYPRLAFIDLFASAGVSRYRQGAFSTLIPGSSTIAAMGTTQTGGVSLRFDEIVSVDRSPANLDVLEQNLSQFGYQRGKNFFPIATDTSRIVEAVGKHLSETPGTHALIFADPEGLEPAFDAIQSLVRAHDAVDLMILHLVSGAAMSNSRPALRRFYGCEPPAKLTREGLSKLYISQIEKNLRPSVASDVGSTTIVEPVRIEAGQGTGGYSYDLLFAWRRTSGGNSFTRIIESLRKQVEKLDGRSIEREVEAMSGSQSRLDKFYVAETGGTGN